MTIDFRALKPCPLCKNKIFKEPVIDFHENRYSILCPYCLHCRSDWVDTVEAAVKNWNEDMAWRQME